MNISEMHILFRQYAQQMGMQNVRAILPTQIDALLNSSVTDNLNKVIAENVIITSDRNNSNNAKIGQINALRNLYKTIDVVATPTDTPDYNNPFIKDDEEYFYKLVGEINNFTQSGFNYFHLSNLSINYKNTDNKNTNYFKVRLIDDTYLVDTLNDSILKPTIKSPVATVSNKSLHLYIDNSDSEDNLPQNVIPNNLRVSYIAIPSKLSYDSPNDVCDLPEFMHDDIVKHAVDLYRIAVNNSAYLNQRQPQSQERNNINTENYQF